MVKVKIAEAFVNLLSKKDIDKITVKDIVEESGVTRQTFYYHFKDIFDLIEWAIKADFAKSRSELEKYETPEEAMEGLIKSAFVRQDFMKKILGTKHRDILEKIFIDASRENLLNLAANHRLAEISAGDLDAALNFYSFAIAGFVLGLCEKKEVDTKHAAAQLVKLINGKLFQSDKF